MYPAGLMDPPICVLCLYPTSYECSAAATVGSLTWRRICNRCEIVRQLLRKDLAARARYEALGPEEETSFWIGMRDRGLPSAESPS